MPRIFYQLLVNTLAVSVMNFTVFFAVTFYVYLQTRSVFATGIIAGIFLTLTALSGMWFGSLVDHHRKRQVMIASTVASLALYAMSLAVYLVAGDAAFEDPTSATLWAFILLQLVGVIIGNLRGIALSTTVTLLVPEGARDRANGLIGTVQGVTFLLTSVISGLLVGLAGMRYVLILAAVILSAAVVHLLLLAIPGDTAASGDGDGHRVDIRGTLVVVRSVPGLLALVFFGAINNFLGGVFMALVDAYGLSLVSVEAWGVLWGLLSSGFIVGGLVIARRGLGRNPVRSILLANLVAWTACSVFTLQSSILLAVVGLYAWACIVPVIEASEQTVLQRVVPFERQGRVFGFAQSVEQAAAPLTAFLISPVAQFVFIPFMTTGSGVDLIGGWFGTGPERGLALLFTLAGLCGLVLTVVALRSPYYRLLSERYLTAPAVSLEGAPASEHRRRRA